ncbi:SWIM zinc finger family protein [Magnetospirillum gryphiswaldense]|uniref:SWIM zinc finger family protein n=1 Tax=Magnetospirillum gryphiswaldense TaxID=55518 RepID=UPI000D210739|nr:DUF6880 family protein [Magnetospirillum gryphiswaldense]AVM76174.1 hypothetical protein MSR1_37160 [Magnetospirillum gryphiswaldense MSR-1]AVM80077.1 hypothetical protein MSR1L_37160 [Magnetospirillum gryphiswaldense]
MTGRPPPRFDGDALRRLAGDAVFARGLAYHQAGQVTILMAGPDRVVARVTGSELYHVVLTGGGTRIGGECSCPAFEDRGFCKHLVATALTANDAGPATGDDALERIRIHLRGRDADSLVAMIVDLAERDDRLFRRLDMEATSAAEDEKTVLSRLRKAITDATRTGGFVHYREAASWADDVESVLDPVAGLVPTGRPALALRLIDHALDRIEKAVGEIDDSDGHGTVLLNRARDIHLAACRAARPEPVALARDLFAREVEGEWDTFDGAVELYAEVLGESGLAQYRRLAAEAWQKIPPRIAGERGTDDFASVQRRLAGILDFFAERDGDVDARIGLRTHDLSSPWRYLELARFCLAAGREADALRHAEDGLWLFEDDPPDERLVGFAVDLHLGTGQPGAAEALLWRAFERQPSLDLYHRLRGIGGEPARDRAITALRDRLAKSPPRTRWSSPADLLIRVLMAESLFTEAWGVVRDHGAGGGLKEMLARASETTHPREALAVHAARIDQLVEAGGNPNYEEACKLIARMGALRGADEQTAHVLDLKTRFKAKRNFMKLLGK